MVVADHGENALEYDAHDGRLHVKNVTVASLMDIRVTNPSQLKCLNVSDNVLRNVRAGQDLPSLQHLTLSRNWIVEMGPVRQFPHLVQLDLSNNNIRQVEGIETLAHLQVLNLSHNDLRNFLSIRPLSLNQSIRVLQLHNNFVATLSGYRARVSSLLPHAVMLDDIRFPRFAMLKKMPSHSCRACGQAALPPHVALPRGRPLSKDEQELCDALRSKPRAIKKPTSTQEPKPPTSKGSCGDVGGKDSVDGTTRHIIEQRCDRQKPAKATARSRHMSSIERKLMRLITTKDDRKAHIPLSKEEDPINPLQLSNQWDVDALTSIEDANDSKRPSPTARANHLHPLDDMFTDDMAYHEEKIHELQSNQVDRSAVENRVEPSYAFNEAWARCAALKNLFDTSLPMYDDQVIALAQAAAEDLPFQNVHLGTVLREFAQVLSVQQPSGPQGRLQGHDSSGMKQIRRFLSRNPSAS